MSLYTHTKEATGEYSPEKNQSRELLPSSELYIFPSEQPHESNANIYALICGGEVFLFDCGNAGSCSRLTSMLAEHHLGIKNIKKILLTDIHADHCGLAKELQETNPTISVHVPNAGLAYLLACDPFKTAWYLYPHLHPKYGRYSMPCPTINGRIKNGDTFEFHGHHIIALKTPGHSPAAMTFIVDDKLAIAGDAFNGSFNFKTIGSDKPAWYKTNDVLLATAFTHIVDGHCDGDYLPQSRAIYKAACARFGTQTGTFKDLINYW
jgi:glyoxylase-like metal-dependent hydrolase (beta-lactamase superfamily II)